MPRAAVKTPPEVAPSDPITDGAPVMVTCCAVCGARLTWRDTAYVPPAREQCKRCYQTAARQRLRGWRVSTAPAAIAASRVERARQQPRSKGIAALRLDAAATAAVAADSVMGGA